MILKVEGLRFFKMIVDVAMDIFVVGGGRIVYGWFGVEDIICYKIGL